MEILVFLSFLVSLAGNFYLITHLGTKDSVVGGTIVMPKVELPEGYEPPSAAVITPPVEKPPVEVSYSAWKNQTGIPQGNYSSSSISSPKPKSGPLERPYGFV